MRGKKDADACKDRDLGYKMGKKTYTVQLKGESNLVGPMETIEIEAEYYAVEDGVLKFYRNDESRFMPDCFAAVASWLWVQAKDQD